MTSTETPEGPKAVRDFTYIKPSGKRLSEYEAVNLYVQIEDGLLGSDGWFIKRPDYGTPWRAESTRLRHPHWFDFRDPAKLWQRTFNRNQAEQERAIERVTEEAVEGGTLADIDQAWLDDIIRDHYAVWSFVDWGTFRPCAAAQRESLSDTLGSVFVFEGLNRLRHAQDIVVHTMELEAHVPGFSAGGAKERWLNEARYQPTRQMIEQLMHNTWDWGELAVAIALALDPIVSDVALFQLIRKHGPFHGDLVTPFIVSTVERDRRWTRDWVEALVKMVTADDVPQAKENLVAIQEWVDKWTPRALDAAGALAEVYERVPQKGAPFEQVLSGAMAGQKKLLESMGLSGGGTT